MKTPSRIGEYRVLAVLGQGGMGAVYKVQKDSVIYALKTILPEYAHKNARLRFEREALAAAAVDKHPNIVSIHKLELNAQPPFILMDFVEGQSLDQWIAQDEPWPLERVIQFLEPLAKALDHMHSKGVIHRDLKPANILIRDHDRSPLITDFGIAKEESLEGLTKTGEMLGTPEYMAPEQFSAEPISAATDLWALAVIAYQLITPREHPFLAESTTRLAQKVLFSKPRSLRPFLPKDAAGLDQVFAKAFSKDPADRFPGPQSFISDLHRVLHKQVPRSAAASKHSMKVRGLYALIALLAATVLVIALNRNHESAPPQGHEDLAAQNSIAYLKDKKLEYSDHLIEHILWSLGKPSSTTTICPEIQKHCQVIARSKYQRSHKKMTSFFLPCFPFENGQLERLDKLAAADKTILKAFKYFSNEDYEKAIGLLSSEDKQANWGEAADLIRCASYARLGKGTLALKHKVKIQKTKLPRAFDDLILSEGLFYQFIADRGLTPRYRQIFNRFYEKNDLVFFNAWRSLSARYCESMLAQKKALALYNVYKDLEKLECQYPRLPRLTLTVPMFKLILTKKSRRNNDFEDLYFHYQIQRAEPSYRLPAHYNDYCTDGRVHLRRIQSSVFQLYYSNTKEIPKLLDLMLFCSRAGFFTESFISPNLSLDILQEKLIKTRQKAAPWDPYLRIWILLFDRLSRDLPFVHGSKKQAFLQEHAKHFDRIESEFTALLQLNRLPQVYQAILYERRAELSLHRYGLNPENTTDEKRKEALSDIRNALKLGNPFPQKLFRSFRAFLTSMPREHKDFKSIRKEANLQFELCEKLTRRRGQEKESPVTQCGDSYYMLEPLLSVGVELQLSVLYYERALLHEQLGELQAAQIFIIESISLAQIPGNLLFLVNIMRRTKDVKAIQSLIIPKLEKAIPMNESALRKQHIRRVIQDLKAIQSK